MNFDRHRPNFAAGKGDTHLPRLIRDLKKQLLKSQRRLLHDTLRLDAAQMEALAHMLVEMAEDLHNDIGLWRALEQYNREFFGVPLPLTGSSALADETPSLMERIAHFLWIFYAELDPDLIIPPTHPGLRGLAESAANFLEARLSGLPQDSGIKRFLSTPNREGWEVKGKLIWLGMQSYLFRFSFQNYIADQEGKVDINTIDDFVCQITTAWSGLGAIDILAGALELPPAERAELRSWYERHAAYYRVERVKKNRLYVTNLVNDAPYEIRMDGNASVFKAKQVVYGSLVPWHGMWYWSGDQMSWGEVPEVHFKELREQVRQQMPRIVYRYDKERLAEAEAMLARYHKMFIDYHGGDLAIFPDGQTMAAAMQEMYTQYNEARIVATGKRGGLPPEGLALNYPPELLNRANGVAVYFNPDEGVEIVVEYNALVSGLKKRGQGLSEDEAWAIQGVMQSEAISASFMQRLAAEYGSESMAEAFLIRRHLDQPYVDYLLRRYKGVYYRRRYPNLSIV